MKPEELYRKQLAQNIMGLSRDKNGLGNPGTTRSNVTSHGNSKESKEHQPSRITGANR